MKKRSFQRERGDFFRLRDFFGKRENIFLDFLHGVYFLVMMMNIMIQYNVFQQNIDKHIQQGNMKL